MPTPEAPNKVEIVLHLQGLKEELCKAEKEYTLSLSQDKEFEVLKELKLKIKDLKLKILSYSDIVNNLAHIP